MKDVNKLSLFVIFLMLSSAAKAQFIAPKSKLELHFQKNDSLDIKQIYPTFSFSKKNKKLPLFCHIEAKMEQTSQIPVRFRLGNLNYVNALEYKN